jgi:hypothetical protein
MKDSSKSPRIEDLDPASLRSAASGGAPLQSGKQWLQSRVLSQPAANRVDRRQAFPCGAAARIEVGSSAWRHVHSKNKQNAHQLREALDGAIKIYCSGQWGRAEIEAAGRRDYEGVTGHAISGRHFWRLFDKVIANDGGRRDFNNLALYLLEQPSRKAQPDEFDRIAKDLPSLASAIRAVADVNAPTDAETLLVWTHAMEEYERLIDGGLSTHKTTRRVVELLHSSGLPLAKSRAVLRRIFARRVDRWIDGGRVPSAIEDLRAKNSGHRRPLPLSEDDIRLLTARGLTGGLTKAWRDALRNGDLSPAAVQAYLSNPASKSYVPSRVRELVGPDVEMLQDIHHGPRQAKLNGAFITRDWSAVSPADWYQADDTTLPLYYWETDEHGQLHVMRGQFLPMIDCRTNRVLSFALHSERNYTAKVIRGLIVNTHDTYGLPRVGFYFENGIWRSSKLVRGQARGADDVPPEETELGLREWVAFRHAAPGNARAKPVERVIGMLQDRMEDQPGYCGRNEQTEKFERVQAHLRQVQAGKVPPSEFFLHKEEWYKRLDGICEAYNDERQDGKLKGLSPREAWDSLFDASRPLVRLTPETRYLLANHRRPETITKRGICIQVRKGDSRWFYNEITGRLVGRRVQAYFDPEATESIFIKLNPADKTAAVIPAAPEVPAMSASPQQLGAAMARVDSHNRPARTLYKTIEPHFPENAPSPFRQVVADAETVETGEEIAAEQAAIRDQQAEQFKTQRKLSNIGRRFGSGFTNNAIPAERRLEMIEFAKEAAKDANAPTEP